MKMKMKNNKKTTPLRSFIMTRVGVRREDYGMQNKTISDASLKLCSQNQISPAQCLCYKIQDKNDRLKCLLQENNNNDSDSGVIV